MHNHDWKNRYVIDIYIYIYIFKKKKNFVSFFSFLDLHYVWGSNDSSVVMT